VVVGFNEEYRSIWGDLGDLFVQEGLPHSYYVSVILVSGLFLWGTFQIRRNWSLPFLTFLATVAIWYLVEPIYTPEEFSPFPNEVVSAAFWYVSLSISSFMIFFIMLKPIFAPRKKLNIHEYNLRDRSKQFARGAERLLPYATLVWFVLVGFGTMRLGGDIAQALFPIEGRMGAKMWSRGAAGSAGSAGFLISTASYLYILICAIFGAMLPVVGKNRIRIVLIILICLSWPYLLLQGSRNQALAVILPMLISYYMFSKASSFKKISYVAIGLAFTYFWFGVVIEMRAQQASLWDTSLSDEITHRGLNMASELCWIVYFFENYAMQPTWGGRYIAEILNFVPRAIWPDKPAIGIEYALLRGFGGGNTDIGLVATVSTGFIGQGMDNFGPALGSICAGLLMACWALFLFRLRAQGSLSRQLLFIVGLGLTINLGRDITLLTLFPFVFFYVAVLVLESFRRTNRARQKRAH
jgi:oligosaccharide repeat unit polymerase